MKKYKHIKQEYVIKNYSKNVKFNLNVCLLKSYHNAGTKMENTLRLKILGILMIYLRIITFVMKTQLKLLHLYVVINKGYSHIKAFYKILIWWYAIQRTAYSHYGKEYGMNVALMSVENVLI